MTTARANAGPILSADQVEELLVKPVLSRSVATQDGLTCTIDRIDTKGIRYPMVTQDPQAAWVAEGAEVPVSDMLFDEAEATPSKVAGLTVITRELADDSSPAAAAVVGAGLSRDIARKLDAAFGGNVADPAPKGLGSLTAGAGANQVQDIAAGTSISNLDVFEQAVSLSEDEGGVITAYLCSPTTGLMLSNLKESAGSAKNLLQPDPSQPRRRVISGVPLLRSTSVPVGTIWALPAEFVRTVVRMDPTVESDRSVFFTSQRVAVMGTMRVGLAFTHPRALVRIRLAAS